MHSSKAEVTADAGTTSYLDAEALSALNLEPLAMAGGAPSPVKASGLEPGEPMACQGKREAPASAPQPAKCMGEPMACQGTSR